MSVEFSLSLFRFASCVGGAIFASYFTRCMFSLSFAIPDFVDVVHRILDITSVC